MKPVLRSPKRVLIDTAGKWRELVFRERWGRGKSITQLAERWTTSEVPEVDALLEGQPRTAGFSAAEGEVGDRELDLLIEGDAPGGRTLMLVMPVGDEPLGPSVEEELRRSRGDRLRGGLPPVEHMAKRVFNIEASVLGELRYRLLSQTSALLQKAAERGCKQGVLVVHEIRSPLSPRQVVADQRGQLEAWVRKLTHRDATSEAGVLVGPIYNGTNVQLYFGRALVER
jgi:hypothetical protein